MQELTIYRDADALSWLPMRVRVNAGGYEMVSPKQVAVLKTKTSPYTFQVRMLGMKKKVVLSKEDSRNSHFAIRIGIDTNAAFGILLGLMVALFVIGMGINTRPINTSVVAVGILLVPLLLTVAYGRITVVPTEPREQDA
ncbi:MAG TPA: hypothetical protein DCE41_04160 [Cytophagales bacterium]|nr:hypothetical protein [Cytophagales bacterium]HAA18470.1 hypothetical protein [Cytophagales bacterium]HAP61504.1 hypothetical protein [Cytophagales bacterium]